MKIVTLMIMKQSIANIFLFHCELQLQDLTEGCNFLIPDLCIEVSSALRLTFSTAFSSIQLSLKPNDLKEEVGLVSECCLILEFLSLDSMPILG